MSSECPLLLRPLLIRPPLWLQPALPLAAAPVSSNRVARWGRAEHPADPGSMTSWRLAVNLTLWSVKQRGRKMLSSLKYVSVMGGIVCVFVERGLLLSPLWISRFTWCDTRSVHDTHCVRLFINVVRRSSAVWKEPLLYFEKEHHTIILIIMLLWNLMHVCSCSMSFLFSFIWINVEGFNLRL